MLLEMFVALKEIFRKSLRIQKKEMSLTHQLSICLSVGSFVCLTGADPRDSVFSQADIQMCPKVLEELICPCLLAILFLESLSEGGDNIFSHEFVPLHLFMAKND